MQVKERPILMSGPMALAILAGRKTQTRRAMKPQPELRGGQWFWKSCSWTDVSPRCPTGTLESPIDYCPYGGPGDRLRTASRLTLEITAVRVERVQEIVHSPEDLLAEGVQSEEIGELQACEYRDLWDSLNGKKHPWESNPWVWVIEFKGGRKQ